MKHVLDFQYKILNAHMTFFSTYYLSRKGFRYPNKQSNQFELPDINAVYYE